MTTTPKAAPLSRPLDEIAREIRDDWPQAMNAGTYDPRLGMNIGQHWANPYLTTMLRLYGVTDLGTSYFEDNAASVVSYFLSNASSWRGETARRIKAELKAAVADYYAKRRGGRSSDRQCGADASGTALGHGYRCTQAAGHRGPHSDDGGTW